MKTLVLWFECRNIVEAIKKHENKNNQQKKGEHNAKTAAAKYLCIQYLIFM
jgi:hypothetical protein